jgi:hypothetical protein
MAFKWPTLNNPIERELRLSLEVIALAMTQYVEYCENLSRQVQLGL